MAIEQSIKTLSRRKLVLAESDSRHRAETGRYLRSIGMEVFEAGGSSDACNVIQMQSPVLVVVDVDLEGDPARVIRAALDKRRATIESPFKPSTKVILTCKAKTPRDKLLALAGQGVEAILVTPCRPELMIDRLARAIELQDKPHPITSAAAAALRPVSLVQGNNSLLQQQMFCPFHEKQTVARRYALRVNHIETDPNFFDVPVYKQAIGSADFVNYHQLCVTVCPECLFASADPAHFLAPHDRRHLTRQLPSSARYAIISRAQQRREILGTPSNTFFNEHRSIEEAIKSFELANHCSATLHNAAPRQLADELVRQGNYHLRIALLREQLGQSQSLRDKHIEQASRLLKDAYPTLPEANIPRGVYQCVATSIYFGEDHEAHQYLSQLSKLSRQATDPSFKQALERYLLRSARAWEDRDDHRKPQHVETDVARAPFLTAA